jgi:hypothetical protein
MIFDRSQTGSGINYLYAARHGGESLAQYESEQSELDQSTLMSRLSVYARVRAMQLGIQRMVNPLDRKGTSLLRASNYVPEFISGIRRRSNISASGRLTGMYMLLGDDFMLDHPIASMGIYAGLSVANRDNRINRAIKYARQGDLDSILSGGWFSREERIKTQSTKTTSPTPDSSGLKAAPKASIRKRISNYITSPSTRKRISRYIKTSPERTMGAVTGAMTASVAASTLLIPVAMKGLSRVMDMSERLRYSTNMDFGDGTPYAPAAAMSERERALEAIANANMNARSFMGNEASMYHGR